MSSAPEAPTTPLFSRQAGPLALAAGALFIVAQIIWLPFDQLKNPATSREPVYQTASVLYLVGFVVLLFALIAVHGRQAHRAGRFGVAALSAAMVGTVMLGGDLWFEAFAVPWLADSSTPQVLDSEASTLLGLGAIVSYLSFAIGWALFGIASLRARVFPIAISILIVLGGIVGFNALLSPFGLPLGIAMFALGGWLLLTNRARA